MKLKRNSKLLEQIPDDEYEIKNATHMDSSYEEYKPEEEIKEKEIIDVILTYNVDRIRAKQIIIEKRRKEKEKQEDGSDISEFV